MGLEAHGVYYGLKMGVDYGLSKHGPGVLLLEDIVRTGFERRLQRIELLGANDKYKRPWTTATHQRVRLLAFAPSLVGSADLALRRYGRPLARRVRRAASGAASQARSRVAAR
jgi:CelD/BcsL family acetyltransferase involved in cellulose biosynthesis